MLSLLLVSLLGATCQGNCDVRPSVSFSYGGKAYSTEQAVRVETVADDVVARTTREEYVTSDGRLAVTLTIRRYKDFDAVEWLPELSARTAEPTALVADLKSFDFTLTNTPAATVRTLRGSDFTAQDFTPVSTRLATGGVTSVTYGAWGRSSDGQHGGVIPFLGIDQTSMDGLELAVGWSGSWKADFVLTNGALAVSGGLRETHFRMMPGETLRAPSVLVWTRAGVSARDFRTTIHRFMRDVKSPRDAAGKIIPPILPFTVGGGNKSPESMHRQLAWVRENALPFDTLWVDAGWNGSAHMPDQTTNCGNMWEQFAGTWTFNPTIHPAGSLAAVADAVHAAGMKMLLWVEPERVMPDTTVAREHPDYCIKPAVPYLLNLGDPEACAWAIETVDGLIASNRLDIYRQDFNIHNTHDYWRAADTTDRVGVTEMKYIAGLYRFWDTLRARHPNLLLENCASGGRRLDFEMISRAHTYCRTDNAIGNKGAEQIVSMQAISHNLLPYLPFQGSETRPANLNDDYSFFSTIATSGVFTPTDWDAFISREPTAEETAWYRRTFSFVQERMRPYFTGDYYPLTDPIDVSENRLCAWQFHRADLNAGFVVAFRRAAAPGSLRVGFRGLKDSALYRVTHADGTQEVLLGFQLGDYELTRLSSPRTYDVINYELFVPDVVPELDDVKVKERMKMMKSATGVFQSVFGALALMTNCYASAVIHSPVEAFADLSKGNPATDSRGATWTVSCRAAANDVSTSDSLLDLHVANSGCPALQGFSGRTNEGTATEPHVLVNTSGTTINDGDCVYYADEIFMHPNASALTSKTRIVLTFTAPRSGWYSLASRFRTTHPGGTGAVDTSILLDGEILHQEQIVRNRTEPIWGNAYAFTHRFLNKGAKLDFVVGPSWSDAGGWNHACDATALALSLVEEDSEAVPESAVLGVADLSASLQALDATAQSGKATFADVSGLGTWTVYQSRSTDKPLEGASVVELSRVAVTELGSRGVKFMSTQTAAGEPHVQVYSLEAAQATGYYGQPIPNDPIPYGTVGPNEVLIHPGNDAANCVALRFLPASEGAYVVSVRARDISRSTGGEITEGVYVKVFVDGMLCSSDLLSQEFGPGSLFVEPRLMNVRAQAPIDIVVDPRGFYACDGTSLMVKITRLPSSYVTGWDVAAALRSETAKHQAGASNPFTFGGATWTAGASTTLGKSGNFATLTSWKDEGGGCLEGFMRTSGIPVVYGNAASATAFGNAASPAIPNGQYLYQNEFFIHPDSGTYGVVRFTVPSNGVYAVDALCRDICRAGIEMAEAQCGVECHIVANDGVVASDFATIDPHDGVEGLHWATLRPERLYLKTGDVLDLAVAPRQLRNTNCDATAVRATINPQEELRVVSCDINPDGASVFAGAGRVGFKMDKAWTSLVVTPGASTRVTAENLRNDEGKRTGVSFMMDPPQTGAFTVTTGGEGLLADGVSAVDAQKSYGWTLAGLVPSAAYRLYLYGTGGATFAVNGETAVLSGQFTAPNEKAYAVLDVVASAEGTVSGTFAGSAEAAGTFCGLQVEGGAFVSAPGGATILVR